MCLGRRQPTRVRSRLSVTSCRLQLAAGAGSRRLLPWLPIAIRCRQLPPAAAASAGKSMLRAGLALAGIFLFVAAFWFALSAADRMTAFWQPPYLEVVTLVASPFLAALGCLALLNEHHHGLAHAIGRHWNPTAPSKLAGSVILVALSWLAPVLWFLLFLSHDSEAGLDSPFLLAALLGVCGWFASPVLACAAVVCISLPSAPQAPVWWARTCWASIGSFPATVIAGAILVRLLPTG